MATGYHAPKRFPKSPDVLLKRRTQSPGGKMNKAQWAAIIKHLIGQEYGKPGKGKKPRVRKRQKKKGD